MKLVGVCMQCAVDSVSDYELRNVEFDDDCILRVECERGHLSFVVIGAPRFALLFDFGVLAMRDGFFREAVTSFNVALERAYEYFIFDVLQRTLDPGSIETMWKALSKQSERQFGAFAVLYLTETKTPWQSPPNKFVELRNRCVHQGYLPTKVEAMSFGEEAIAASWRVLDATRKDDAKDRMSYELLKRSQAAIALVAKHPGSRHSSMGHPTVVDLLGTTGSAEAQERFREAVTCDSWGGHFVYGMPRTPPPST